MIESIMWGGVLRVLQSTAQAAPFILTGFVVAAVFRRLLGYSNVRRLFGDGTWRSLPQAWVLGMLLPVCSLGVIPVMREMKRAGLSGGTILAFGLTAPLFNPLSVLYGLTLSEPFTIFAFMLASLLVVTLIGVMFDRCFPQTSQPEPELAAAPFGGKRILSVAVSMGREFWSRSTVYMLIGLSGILFLNIVLPKSSFQSSVNGDNVLAPLLMTGVAIPVYATPMLAMSQLGMMFQHGNSVGAAFALLILGAGLNFGIIAWMYVVYGWKRSTAWMVVLLAVVLGLGYGLEKPLYPTDIEPANHTHAFDVYCCPFEITQTRHSEIVWRKLSDDIRPEEIFALYGLLAVAVWGLVVMLANRSFDVEGWLTRHAVADESTGPRYDIILPNWVLGLAAMVCLVIVSVAMCFAYYPPPDECLDEVFVVKGEVLSAAMSGNYDHAAYWLPLWEDWNRRLQVGVYLRHGELSEYHRMKARVVRDYLELLEHAMEDNEKDKVKQYANQLSRAQLRLTSAYREEL